MSQVRVSGNASGTGVFTIASPNSNNNRTLTIPDATTTIVGTDATQSLTNKSFDSASVPTVSGTAPLYFCRAWVNFNGTGTVAIRGSGNVSSITDGGTGTFAINFTTAMPDVNYAAVGTAVNSSSYLTGITSGSNNQLGYYDIRVTTDAGSLNDPNFCSYAFFR